MIRDGKNLKGRVISFVVSTVGKGSLAKALHETVKAIEARNSAGTVVQAQNGREPVAA